MAKSSASGGIGIFGILTIIFVVLKLTGNITWSWFWVLSPLIFSLVLWMIVLVFVLSFFAIVALAMKSSRPKRRY